LTRNVKRISQRRDGNRVMTTVRLDPAVLDWLRSAAADDNRSCGSMIERLLEREMRRVPTRKPAPAYAGVLG
jgi:hypothetical protein